MRAQKPDRPSTNEASRFRWSVNGDVSTPSARGRERHRRIALTTVASVFARLVSIGTLLASVPLALNYLGPERYGLWATIVSLTAILGLVDAGLGNGLVTAIAAADGRGDRVAARQYVSSAFFLLLALACILVLPFALVYHNLPWATVYNSSSPEAAGEAARATAVFVGCFLVSLPLGLAERVQLGYQEGYINAAWSLLGSVGGLVSFVATIHFRGDLPWLVFSMVGVPLAASLGNMLALFTKRRPWLFPHIASASRSAGLRLLRLGLQFFVLQLAVVLTISSDNFVVTHMFGATAVTAYSVPFRLFSVAPFAVALLLSPLWPAYGEALSRGDNDWARRTLVRSFMGVLGVTVLVALLLIAFGTRIIHLWASQEVSPSAGLLVGLAVWSVLWAAGNAIAMFLNGANLIRFQAIVGIIMAITALALKIALGARIGLAGIIWATNAAYFVVATVPSLWYVKRVLRRASFQPQAVRPSDADVLRSPG